MNWYAKAIDVLNSNQDWKALVVAIAKQHPRAVVMAAEPVRVSPEWEREARRLIQSGQFIDAIKLCRTETGCGLKEAKACCDRLKAGMA